MNLYLISWPDGGSWDEYDSAIVCAASEEDAKTICPNGSPFVEGQRSYDWAEKAADITVKLIGTAVPGATKGVELASYNAG
jgi:hypothetical protein